MTDITTKPFVSQAQQRFAFATRQPWARRWARETNFARLPERKAEDDMYTPPAGAQGNARKVLEWRRKYGGRVRGMTRVGWGRARQLASGRPISLAIVKRMAAFNRHRQNATVAPEYQDEPWRDAGYVAWLGWGGDTGINWALEISQRSRTKGEQIAPGITRIRGNLCNVHGKYGPCDAALSGKPKKGGGKKGGGKKPKEPPKTPEQRAQERAAEQAKQRAETLQQLNIAPDGQDALEALRAGKQPDIEALKRGGFEKAGLIEQSATDDTWRLTASGRALLNAADAGDVGRAGATIGSARDRTTARTERQAQTQERKRQVEEKRRQAEQKRQQRAAQSASRGRTAPPAKQSVEEPSPKRNQIARADRVDQAQAQERNRQTLVNRLRQSSQADQRQTEQRRGERAREQAKRERAQEQQQRAQDQQARREEQKQRQERQRTITLRRLASGGRLTDTQVADLEDAGLVEVRANGEPKMTEAGRARIASKSATPIPAEKTGLCIFKDASGKYRWILRTTTAFEDRDREILSTKALEADAQRMTATRQFGPLRYWHVGNPDPFNADAPWGTGLDLGMCDYSIVIGRTSVESGTFFDDRIGAAIAAKAGQYEASPGFFHPSDQPDASGTFWTIRRFERSLVPRQFGRASNRFTGLAVGRTSKSMDQAEYTRRVQAFLADMQALGVPADASAEVIGTVQHQEKSADDQHVAFKDTDCPEDITINGVVYTAKCAAVEQKADETMADMPAEDSMDMDESVGGLTLSEDDLAAIAERVGQVIANGLAEALAPLVGAMNIEAKMAGMMEEMKGALGGYIKKKDAEGAEQRQQLADLAQRTADLAQQTGSLAATVKQATVKVDELLGEQPEVTPGRASTSPGTQIDPTSPADQVLLAAAKTQLPLDNPFADILSQLFNQPSP